MSQLAYAYLFGDINPHSFEEVLDQGKRKAIMVEVFIIFIIFFIQAVRFPLEKDDDELEAQPQAAKASPGIEGEANPDGISPVPQTTSPTDIATVVEAPAENALTREMFHMIINHAIAVGMAQWQACVFSCIIAWFHLIFFLLVGFGRFKERPALAKVGHIGAALINIILLIVGLSNV